MRAMMTTPQLAVCASNHARRRAAKWSVKGRNWKAPGHYKTNKRRLDFAGWRESGKYLMQFSSSKLELTEAHVAEPAAMPQAAHVAGPVIWLIVILSFCAHLLLLRLLVRLSLRSSIRGED